MLTPEPSITPKYSFGVTDVESWSSLWKAAQSDPDPDPEEWVTFMERIQEYFHSRYETIRTSSTFGTTFQLIGHWT